MRVRFAVLALLFWLAPLAVRPSDGRAKPVSFSILEDYEKGEDLDDVDRDFALFRELGITTWRGSFAWDHYEPRRGEYDFTWLQQFAARAGARGITLRPYVGYTPSWAAAGGRDKDAWNDPPKRLADWYRFVQALAAAMRRYPNVVSFEIYNEEDVVQWWEGTPAAYNAVLRRAVDAIRSANPRLDVLFGGMVYPDARWVRYACTTAHNGGRFGILPFHAYPETWTPPDVDVEHYLGDRFEESFVAAADAACGRKRIWINETGFATVDGKTEHDQAEWWARAVPTFLAAPRVEHIGVYEIKDLTPEREAIGDAANYHLGITRADRTKKLAFATVQHLVALFKTPAVIVDDEAVRVAATSGDPSNVYRHLFTRADGRQLLFLWDKQEPIDVSVTLPRQVARLIAFDATGREIEAPAVEGATIPNLALERGDVRLFMIVP